MNVNLVTGDGIERVFTPEHAQSILILQVRRKMPECYCWKLKDENWEFENGILKRKNGTKENTGLGAKPKKPSGGRTGEAAQSED
jgi:hypothetical protein